MRSGSIQCVDLLLKAGTDVNFADNDGRTALFYAVFERSVQSIKQLLNTGADLKMKEHCGITALFDAVWKESATCIELLLQEGADVNIRDKRGKTALFEGIHSDECEGVDLLLKVGADVNATDKMGNSLLHEAPSCLKGIRKVLDEGVKVNVRNNHGFNALTFHLKNIKDGDKTDDKLDKKFVQLLFAAGEIIDESKLKKVPDCLKKSEEISLMNICRETIRKHLLQMSNVNLFVRVPRLPLPQLMTSYLLYDVTLNEEEDAKDNM